MATITFKNYNEIPVADGVYKLSFDGVVCKTLNKTEREILQYLISCNIGQEISYNKLIKMAVSKWSNLHIDTILSPLQVGKLLRSYVVEQIDGTIWTPYIYSNGGIVIRKRVIGLNEITISYTEEERARFEKLPADILHEIPSKAEVKAETTTETKAEVKTEVKAETTTEVKAEVKTKIETTTELIGGLKDLLKICNTDGQKAIILKAVNELLAQQ